MSLSFLSRRDVESWVPETALPEDGAGFIAKIFTIISKAMASLTKILSKANDEALRRCRNELERLFLWGQGLSVGDGNLDEVLVYSKELHFQVLSLLLRLGTTVLQGLSRDSVPLSQVLTEQCDDLQTILDTAETILRESEPNESARPYTPSGSDTSEYELLEILDEISIYIDCLLDLSTSLDNPALDIQVEGSNEPPTHVKEAFTISSEEALIYCRKIRDRFETLPKYLVERLAEANAIRAVALRNMRSQHTKSEAPISDNITESLFSTADQPITETTKSAVPSSVFSSGVEPSFKLSKVTFSEFDDNVSEATFASFSTAVSEINLGRPRVPPMPESQGSGLDCPICFLRITNVKTRKEWKKHVFDDLKPYVCTIEDCSDTATLYNHSAFWVKHEVSHPPSASRSSDCPFCSAIYRNGGPTSYKHMSAHFREVSLSVLPQQADDDEGFDTDNSDMLLSDPDSEQIDQDTNLDENAEPMKDPFLRDLEERQSEPRIPQNYTTESSSPISATSLYQSPTSQYPIPKDQRYGFPSAPETEVANTESGLTTEPDPTSEKYASESAFASAAESTNTSDLVDIDSILDRLLEVHFQPDLKQVQLLKAEIEYLCGKAREIFLSQPMFLELGTPLKYHDLLQTMEYKNRKIEAYGGFPPKANYLLLGNYVDYGTQSIETVCLILAYKIKYPENFFPLRGNHECRSMNRICGFYDECKARYNIPLWESFNDMFDCMPVAALVDDRIFCVHGGLSPDLQSMEQIKNILRPIDIPNSGLLCDLLWSNPEDDMTGWSESKNDHCNSFHFGTDVVASFLKENDLELIVRGHQVVEDGYEFFAKRQLVTLWGAPNYRGKFDNAAAAMSIDEELLCSFQTVKAAEKEQQKVNPSTGSTASQ